MIIKDINMKTMKRKFMFLALLPLLASCSIYHPQAVDMPLINHAGDVRVDANLSMSAWLVPDATNLNLTGSVGITDALAGQLHVNYGGDNAYVQAAPGLYFPVGENFVVETYAGFGYGGIWRDDDGTSSRKQGEGANTKTHSYSGKYMLPFVQLNTGWHDLGAVHFGIAFGVKAGAYMPDFHYSEYDAEGALIPDRSEHYTTTNVLIEPQVQIGIGGEHVRWVTRLGYSWLNDVSTEASGTTFMNDWITVGTGLQFTF